MRRTLALLLALAGCGEAAEDDGMTTPAVATCTPPSGVYRAQWIFAGCGMRPIEGEVDLSKPNIAAGNVDAKCAGGVEWSQDHCTMKVLEDCKSGEFGVTTLLTLTWSKDAGFATGVAEYTPFTRGCTTTATVKYSRVR